MTGGPFRQELRAEGVKPVITHREFAWTGIENKSLLDDMTYHQRSNVEATGFGLRRRYGDVIRARTWDGQFREPVLTCAVRNLESSLSDYCVRNQVSKRAQTELCCLVCADSVLATHGTITVDWTNLSKANRFLRFERIP